MKTIAITGGTEWTHACEDAWTLSIKSNEVVSFEFNEVLYMADALSGQFTTTSTDASAIDRAAHATKIIPIYGDPVIADLQDQIGFLQDQVRSLYSQIIQRKSVLMGELTAR